MTVIFGLTELIVEKIQRVAGDQVFLAVLRGFALEHRDHFVQVAVELADLSLDAVEVILRVLSPAVSSYSLFIS